MCFYMLFAIWRKEKNLFGADTFFFGAPFGAPMYINWM